MLRCLSEIIWEGKMGRRKVALKEFHSVETTTDAPEQKQWVSFFQRKKISEEANAELMTAMASLATSMRHVT